MIIDSHVHYFNEPNYVENHIEKSKELGILKICLSGMGVATCSERFKLANNDSVRKAMRQYPDIIVGLGFIHLGIDTPDKVNALYEQGFRGLKAIYPTKNYDDKSFYPIYARAEDLGMPILFHTGISARQGIERSFDVSSARMQPIFLDTIARAFPDLILIAAHCGNPWFDVTSELVRWHPNIYFDLSGSTLKKKSPQFFSELFWWDKSDRYRGPDNASPYDKILFGSDVHFRNLPEVLNDYTALFDGIGLDSTIRDKILHNNAAKIFGLEL